MITTSQNKQVKLILKLKKSAKERRKQKLFIVEGIRMFEEIPKDRIYKVFVTEKFRDAHVELFETREAELVSARIMKEISDTMMPQGVLALVKMQEYQMTDLLGDKEPLLLVLENIQDPGNLGTILRTGEGAGITGVIMSRDTVDIYNPKVIRSTMGSIFRVPFTYIEQMEEAVRFLKKNQVTTYAAHLDGANYTKENFKGAAAFFIGNEGKGLSVNMTQAADKMIKIPMHGKVESLNAAMASGLLVYEARRQREEGGE